MNTNNTIKWNISSEVYKKLSQFPLETGKAINCLINIVKEHLQPIYLHLEEHVGKVDSSDAASNNPEDILILCFSLLSKYVQLLKQIFQREIESSCVLQESRNWAIGRLVWTLQQIDQISNPKQSGCSSTFIDYEGDEFIVWTDKALEVLENIRKYFENDFERENLKIVSSVWKIQCTTDLFNFHSYVKDMVSGAMKTCQNCLSSDQNIIIARCHVVFRELKKLLAELTSKPNINIENFVIRVEDVKPKENLHYPTVRLLCDVLRDAIYNLEATINRAVLGLVVDSMTDPLQPMEAILEHSKNKMDSTSNECLLEKFDVHIERLVQIGSFSISCSADKNRIFKLKNCLVTIEDLEVQLISSILSNPQSVHSDILIKQWGNEMNSLKLLVYLIIDPVALVDLVMDKFRNCLINMKNENTLKWDDAQHLISLGKCIFDFIQIYKENEPASLMQYDKVVSCAGDLHKVLRECSAVCFKFLSPKNNNSDGVSNNIKSDKDEVYNQGRILKRLKLLYAILVNISQQVMDESASMDENDSDVVDANDYPITSETYTHKGVIGLLNNFRMDKVVESNCEIQQNNTKTLYSANNQTFSRSTIMRIQSKRNNSVFAKCSPLVSSNFYKKHEGSCVCNSASFFSSVCPNEEFLLADISGEDLKRNGNCLLESLKQENVGAEKSNIRRNLRRSLRKTLLMNKVKLNAVSLLENTNDTGEKDDMSNTKDMCIIEEIPTVTVDANTTDWHITEILEQLSRLSNTLSLMNIEIDSQLNSIAEKNDDNHVVKVKVIDDNHIVKLKVNDDNQVKVNVNNDTFSSPKNVWNIKITGSNTEEKTVDSQNIYNATVNECDGKNAKNITIDCGIDVSFLSNVATPERLKDLHQLEEKLANLKQFWKS